MIPYILSTFPIVLFVNWKNNPKAYKRALIVWCLVLVALAGLRGNISSDFNGYYNIFKNYSGYNWSRLIGILNFKYHFSAWELGYVIENFLVSRFTEDYMWVQIVTALITYGCLFKYISKSKDPIISVLSFLSIGIFLEGFNTVRGVMAACIWSLSLQYVVKKDFKRYLLVVLIASLFHTLAIIMIPFYFILDKRPNAKMIFAYIFGAGTILAFVDKAALLLNGFMGFTATQNGILEMLHGHKYSFGAVFFSVVFSMFCIVLYYYLPKYFSGDEAVEEIVYVNGVIIWMILRLFMMRFGYAERFAEFFSVCIILLLPMQLEKFNKQSKFLLKILIAIIFIGYYLYASQSMYGYYKSIF